MSYEGVGTPSDSGSSNNAYATVAEAEDYFDGVLRKDAWVSASSSDKLAALIQATTAMDRLNFVGELADEEQTLQFPRNNDTDVPDDIKFACAEEALSLLDEKDPEIEFEMVSVPTAQFGQLKTSMDTRQPPPHIIAGIMSIKAWRFLLHYLQDPAGARIARVS